MEARKPRGRPAFRAGKPQPYMLRVRLTEEERRDLDELASAAGMDASAFVRWALLQAKLALSATDE